MGREQPCKPTAAAAFGKGDEFLLQCHGRHRIMVSVIHVFHVVKVGRVLRHGYTGDLSD